MPPMVRGGTFFCFGEAGAGVAPPVAPPVASSEPAVGPESVCERESVCIVHLLGIYI